MTAPALQFSDAAIEGAVLRLLPECLYWAILDAPPRRAGAEALRYAFEPWLPAPLEEVETRFAPTHGRVLACGVDRDRLAAWIEHAETDGRRIESVRPAAVPAVAMDRLGGQIDETAICRRLEFRASAFESPRHRRRRIRNAGLLAIAIAAAALIDAAGSLRQAQAARDRAAAAERAATAIAAAAVGESARSVDPRLALGAELRRLRRTRDRSVENLLAEDRTGELVALMAAWPADTPTAVDRVDVDQDAVSVRGRVRDAGDFERLRLALRGFAPGWSEQAGDLSREREGASFSVVFRRDAAAQGGRP